MLEITEKSLFAHWLTLCYLQQSRDATRKEIKVHQKALSDANITQNKEKLSASETRLTYSFKNSAELSLFFRPQEKINPDQDMLRYTI